MTAEVAGARLPAERPMSWSEYVALVDDVRGEYIDGCLVVTPFPGRRHQGSARRLANLLEEHVPDGYAVVTGRGGAPGWPGLVVDVEELLAG